MTLIAPKCGEILLLRYIVNLSRDDTDHNVLHLFKNNITPGESTTTSSFTEPTAPTGYAPITLVGSLWTIEQVGDVTTAVFSEQTFSFGTGVSIYGYFVTDTSDNLLWAEMFSGSPFELPSGGGTITIVPKLTLE